MNASKANLINAATLIIAGLFGYFLSNNPSPTALIPVFAGIVILLFYWGIKKSSKIQAHIAVLLTLVILISLYMPLKGAIARDNSGAIARVLIMMGTGVLALIYFIKSFIDARRNRA